VTRVALLALVLALAGACASSGGGELGGGAAQPAAPAQRSAPDDSDPAGVIPAGPETILDLDVAQLRVSLWSRALLASAHDEERAEKAAAQGYDDIADVDRVLFAVSEGDGEPTTLMVARGRFDEARLAAAHADGWTAGEWRGSRLWQQGEHAVALVTAQTVVTGTPAAVRGAIDCAWGLAADVRAGAIGPLRREIYAPPARPAAAAIVTLTDATRKRVGDSVELPAGLQRVGVRLDLDRDLDVQMIALMDSPGDADTAARIIQAAVRDLRTRRALTAFGLTAIFDDVTVRTHGARLRGRLRLAEDRREELAERIAAVIEAIGRARSAGK
jgi:hypothetical protein